MGWDSAPWRAWGFAVVLVVMAALPSYARADPTAPENRRPHIIFTIDVDRITESSALVNSTAHPRLVYTANDSGDGPYVYALDHEGRLVGTTTLSGVDPVDIEAMAAGTDGSLVVADIGDNAETRASVQVYRIPQPTRGNHKVSPDKVTLTYVGGPRNAESVLYDAAKGSILVVSKEVSAHVYTTPAAPFGGSSAVLRPVAVAPPFATDAALLPGGRQAVVRQYGAATVYEYPSWDLVTRFDLPAQKQGESISGVPGQAVVWVGSEGVDSPVWSVPLPPAPKPPEGPGTPTVSAPPTTGQPPTHSVPPTEGAIVAEGGAGEGHSVLAVSVSAAALVIVVGAVLLLSRTRRVSGSAR